MDKQTKEAREMAKQLPFKEKISHFWEYHKLHVFFAVVALILVGTTVIQVSNREKYDLEIAYYGGMYFTEEQAVKLEEYKLTFGRYKDQLIVDVYKEHKDYLEWMSANMNMQEPLKTFVNTLLKG